MFRFISRSSEKNDTMLNYKRGYKRSNTSWRSLLVCCNTGAQACRVTLACHGQTHTTIHDNLKINRNSNQEEKEFICLIVTYTKRSSFLLFWSAICARAGATVTLADHDQSHLIICHLMFERDTPNKTTISQRKIRKDVYNDLHERYQFAHSERHLFQIRPGSRQQSHHPWPPLSLKHKIN